MTQQRQLPKACREKLVVRELGDEVLIYDLEQHQAHCLNRTAGMVWKYADGERAVADIAALLEKDFQSPVSQELVELALFELEKYGLMQQQESVLALPEAAGVLAEKRMSRREMVRRAGLAAVIALPIITSLVAPQPAAAGSCGGIGTPCTSSIQCCGTCTSGFCA